MKLYKFNIAKLRQDETAAFMQRFITDFEALNLDSSAEPDFILLKNEIQDQLPTYILAIKQTKALAESKQIRSLDDARDKKFSTLRIALTVFRNSDEPTEKTAYELLKLVFNTYKDVAKDNYETESLNLTKMISELRNATHLPAVQLLGLESHLNNLEIANEAFKNLFSTRSTNMNTTVVYDAKMLNKKIIKSYRKLANYILTMVSIKDVPFYAAVFTMNNNIRQYYANILATRNTKPEA